MGRASGALLVAAAMAGGCADDVVKARQAIAIGQCEVAVSLLEERLRARPDDAAALVAMGDAQLACVAAAVSAAPKDASPPAAVEERLARAVSSYESAAKADPSSCRGRVRALEARILGGRGKDVPAADVDAAISACPGDKAGLLPFLLLDYQRADGFPAPGSAGDDAGLAALLTAPLPSFSAASLGPEGSALALDDADALPSDPADGAAKVARFRELTGKAEGGSFAFRDDVTTVDSVRTGWIGFFEKGGCVQSSAWSARCVPRPLPTFPPIGIGGRTDTDVSLRAGSRVSGGECTGERQGNGPYRCEVRWHEHYPPKRLVPLSAVARQPADAAGRGSVLAGLREKGWAKAADRLALGAIAVGAPAWALRAVVPACELRLARGLRYREDGSAIRSCVATGQRFEVTDGTVSAIVAAP